MPLIRYPGSVRARVCAIVVIAVGLLVADGVRRYWATRESADARPPTSAEPGQVLRKTDVGAAPDALAD